MIVQHGYRSTGPAGRVASRLQQQYISGSSHALGSLRAVRADCEAQGPGLTIRVGPGRLRNKRDELEICIDAWNQGHLAVGADPSLARSKGAGSAFARPHILLAPVPRERLAVDLQFGDQSLRRRLTQVSSCI